MATEEEQESKSLLASSANSEDHSEDLSEEVSERTLIPPLLKAKLTTFEIIIRIIFPPLLLWDLLKFATRFFFGNLAALVVLQSLGYSKEESNKDFTDQLLIFANSELTNEIEHQRNTIETHDNAKIDTITFSVKNSDPTNDSGIYIIHCNGSGETFEPQLINLALDARDLACTVIGFNYRGVGNSSPNPTAFRDLANDAIAVTQDLLNKGVDPENIVLQGFSLGGVVASYVNKQLLSLSDNQDKSLYIYADRSPASFTKFAIGFVRRMGQFIKTYFNQKREGSIIENIDGYTENPFWKFIGAISYPFVKFGLYATEWDAEASKIFQETPTNHRALTVVKSSSETRSTFHPADDHITSDYASLHRALKTERRALKTQGADDEAEDNAQAILRKASRFSSQTVGHWQAPINLVSKNFGEGITVNGQQHFQCFVRATHPEAYADEDLKDEERILQDAWKTAGY